MIQVGKVCVVCFAKILQNAFLQIFVWWFLREMKIQIISLKRESAALDGKTNPIFFVWRPNLDIIIQSRRSQNRKCGMTFKTIYHAFFVARQPLDNCLGISVPHEEVTAITSAHHKFGIRSKEIHTFYSCWIPRIDKQITKWYCFSGKQWHAVTSVLTCVPCMSAKMHPASYPCCRTDRRFRYCTRPKFPCQGNCRPHKW